MSETALLEGVRDHLRELCGYAEDECEIEYDEQMPSAAGQFYVVVTTAQWATGPNNSIGGGVLDELYGVDVIVVIRSPDVPRDMKRGILLESLDGLNAHIAKIRAAVHFSIPLMDRVNALITDSHEKFKGQLKFAGCDSKAHAVGPELFAARMGEKQAGLARRVMFRDARRTQSVGAYGAPN